MLSQSPHILVARERQCNSVSEECPVTSSFYGYAPSYPPNAILLALFGIALIIHATQGLYFRTWGILAAFSLGCLCEVIGMITSSTETLAPPPCSPNITPARGLTRHFFFFFFQRRIWWANYDALKRLRSQWLSSSDLLHLTRSSVFLCRYLLLSLENVCAAFFDCFLQAKRKAALSSMASHSPDSRPIITPTSSYSATLSLWHYKVCANITCSPNPPSPPAPLSSYR